MTGRPMPAVKALIERDGHFLALRVEPEGKEPLWTLPGGRIEYGESPREALHREVDEEVSLAVDIHEPVGTFHFFFGEEDENQVVLTVFRCTPTEGTVDITSNPVEESITGYEWVTPTAFLQRPAEPTLKDVVQEHFPAQCPKLVRDRIPEIIAEDGREPVTEQLSEEELAPYLADKLVEEAAEFRAGREVDELVDVLDVVDRYLQLEDVNGLAERRAAKRERRGGFAENVLLRDVD